MENGHNQVAACFFMVQSAFREWQTAEEKSMEVGRLILVAANRVEVERLSQQLADAERRCVGPRSRFISATHAYADSMNLTSGAGDASQEP